MGQCFQCADQSLYSLVLACGSVDQNGFTISGKTLYWTDPVSASSPDSRSGPLHLELSKWIYSTLNQVLVIELTQLANNISLFHIKGWILMSLHFLAYSQSGLSADLIFSLMVKDPMLNRA